MQNKFLFILLLILFILPSLCKEVNPSETHKTKTRGHFKFKLIDLKDKFIIKKSDLFIETIFSLKLGIPDEKGEIYFEDRLIKISDEFVVGYNMYGYEELEDICGFGLYLKKMNEATLSWEWYRKVGPNLFDKIQGGGKMEVEYNKHKGYWVISKMRFIGEQTLRAKKKWNLFGSDNWHCVVKDSSYINWYDPVLDGLDNKRK